MCAATVLMAGAIAGISRIVVAAGGHEPRIARVATLADVSLAEFQNSVLPDTITNDRGIRFGSIGSDIFRRHTDPANEFWMTTDRGPNGQPGGRRTFPVPDFNPTILHVKVRGDAIEILEALPIRNPDGTTITGLPNVAGFDETPWNFNATSQIAPLNPNGLDTEGIVRTEDGDFWLVDEYSPSLVHVGADGFVIERIVPIDSLLTGTKYPVFKTLPTIYNKRRQNRGFEGLALSPDGTTLFLGLQSPLEHPTRALGRASRNIRILRFDIASRQVTGEFVYRFDEVCAFLGRNAGCGVAPGDMKLSSLTALSNTKLLVDERTDDVAKVYLVDTAEATDILGGTYDDPLNTTSPLETLSESASSALAVQKQLVVDLSRLPGIPKKIEGITMVNPEAIAIANDNDFGLVDETTFDSDGNLSNDTGAKSHVIFIKLAHPLQP